MFCLSIADPARLFTELSQVERSIINDDEKYTFKTQSGDFICTCTTCPSWRGERQERYCLFEFAKQIVTKDSFQALILKMKTIPGLVGCYEPIIYGHQDPFNDLLVGRKRSYEIYLKYGMTVEFQLSTHGSDDQKFVLQVVVKSSKSSKCDLAGFNNCSPVNFINIILNLWQCILPNKLAVPLCDYIFDIRLLLSKYIASDISRLITQYQIE